MQATVTNSATVQELVPGLRITYTTLEGKTFTCTVHRINTDGDNLKLTTDAHHQGISLPKAHPVILEEGKRSPSSWKMPKTIKPETSGYPYYRSIS